jgi:hypothetical protein
MEVIMIEKIKGIFNLNKIYNQTDLYEAVIDGDLEFVKKNISKIKVEYGGYSCLNAAVIGNNLEIAKELLKDSRIDPTAKRNRSIVAACYYGTLSVLKEILKDKRVDKNQELYFEMLKEAVKKKRKDIIIFILDEEQFNPFTKQGQLYDIVGISFSDSSLEITKLLMLNKNYDPSINLDKDLAYAVERKDLIIIDFILSLEKTNPTRYNNELIREANENNDVEIVNLLFLHKKVRKTLKLDDPILFATLHGKNVSKKISNF